MTAQPKLSGQIVTHIRKYRPGGNITFPELARAMNATPHELRGTVGAMIKRGVLILDGKIMGDNAYRLDETKASDIHIGGVPVEATAHSTVPADEPAAPRPYTVGEAHDDPHPPSRHCPCADCENEFPETCEEQGAAWQMTAPPAPDNNDARPACTDEETQNAELAQLGTKHLNARATLDLIYQLWDHLSDCIDANLAQLATKAKAPPPETLAAIRRAAQAAEAFGNHADAETLRALAEEISA